MTQDQVFEDVGAFIAQIRPSKSVLCFSPARLRAQVDTFRSGFPGRVAWAVKSNPHPEVVKEVVRSGIDCFDVASRSEIELVLRYCPDGEIDFNHPIKSPEDIAFAYFEAGVRSFVVDSFEELRKITAVLSSGGVSDFGAIILMTRFRDPNSRGTGNYDFGAKFGALPGEAAALLQESERVGYRAGLAFHPGSQNRDPAAYASMMAIAQDITREAFGGCASSLARLNIGGGFPCRYPGGGEPPLHEFFEVIRKSAPAFDCEIACEPGRALVACCISVVTRVDLRRRGERRIYINDGLFGSFMEYFFVDFAPPARAYSPDGELINPSIHGLEAFSVWGPTCDSLDRMKSLMSLPSEIGMHDFIEFGMMGAYTNALATSFNGFNPAELVTVNNLKAWGPTLTVMRPGESVGAFG